MSRPHQIRLSRRAVVVAANPLAWLTLPARAAGAAESWVRSLYERTVAATRERRPLSIGELRVALAEDLLALIEAPPVPTDDPDGPVLDVFLGWGVLPGTSVTLTGVHQLSAASAPIVRVDLLVRGEAHSLNLNLAREGDGFRISDIVYDRGRPLRAHLRHQAGVGAAAPVP